MPLIQNTFDGTPGAAATTTTLATAGNAPALVSLSGAVTATTVALGKVHGATGLRVQNTGGASDKWYVRWDLAAATSQGSGDLYFTYNALPTVGQSLFNLIDGAGVVLCAVGILNNAALRAVASGGATIASSQTTGGIITAGQPYRLAWQWRKGTTTTDGQFAYQLYKGDETTALFTFSTTTANVGTTDCARVWLGDNGTSAATDATFDVLRYDDSTQSALAQYVAPTSTPLLPTSRLSSVGTWTVAGGAAEIVALTDGSDATYVQSPDAPVNQELIYVLSGTLPSGAVSVTLRLAVVNGSTGTAKVSMLNNAGTVVGAQQTFTLTGSPADYVYSLTGAEVSAWSGTRSNPRLRVVVNA